MRPGHVLLIDVTLLCPDLSMSHRHKEEEEASFDILFHSARLTIFYLRERNSNENEGGGDRAADGIT